MIDTIPSIAPQNYLGGTNETTLRRQEVVYRILNGQPTDDLAEKHHVALTTIDNDISTIKAWWRKQASRAVNELQEQELQFAYDTRREVLDTWHETKRPQFMGLVLEWTKRIAELWGLDQPTKNINLNVDYNDYAKSQGVNQKELLLGLIQEVANLVKATPVSQSDLQPLIDVIELVKPVDGEFSTSESVS